MAEERNIAADRRYDSQLAAEAKIPQFVPPRPRDRRRLGMDANRAGYWCRRTTVLTKKVAVASREAQEAKAMVRVVQEAHEAQFQQVQEEMKELKQLLAVQAKQGAQRPEVGVRHVSVVKEQMADTQELLADRPVVTFGTLPPLNVVASAAPVVCQEAPALERGRTRAMSTAVQCMSVMLLFQRLLNCVEHWCFGATGALESRFRWHTEHTLTDHLQPEAFKWTLVPPGAAPPDDEVVFHEGTQCRVPHWAVVPTRRTVDGGGVSEQGLSGELL